MPEIEVAVFQEENGEVPLQEWLDEIKPKKALAKCLHVIEMLRQHGFELRRPYTDILRDEIHELRAHLGTVQYRILFFFHEHSAVLSHGLVKKKATVPDKEIDLAVVRKTKYRANPDVHRCKEQLP